MAQVETLIADGGYDYELSMNALVNHAQSSAGYDVAYIMSAYSTSVDQLSATQTDLESKLSGPAPSTVSHSTDMKPLKRPTM